MHPLVKKIITFCAIFVLLYFLANRMLFFRQGFLENAAAKIMYPFLVLTNAITSTIGHITESKDSYQKLESKYQKLQKDYLDIIDLVVELQATHRTYQNLKEVIEFKSRYQRIDPIVAKILVKHFSHNEHYILINRGIRDGIHKDMVAFYQRHVIGRVIEVYDFYSKVMLITDQRCKIAGFTGKTHAPGIVQGYNCVNRCHFTYVSHLFNIQNNDLVISSGEGLVFPQGFCLGKIVVHDLQEKSLYHYVEIEPMINVETISHCLLADGTSINPF